MKKVLATLGTIFGFLGLATLVLFFAETGSVPGYPLSTSRLTADISANAPQLADVSAETAPAAPSTDVALTPTSTQATATIQTTTPTPIPAPAPQPEPQTIPIAPTTRARNVIWALARIPKFFFFVCEVPPLIIIC